MEELPLQHFLFWRHHIEQNDTRANDTWKNDTPANDIWKNDISFMAFGRINLALSL